MNIPRKEHNQQSRTSRFSDSSQSSASTKTKKNLLLTSALLLLLSFAATSAGTAATVMTSTTGNVTNATENLGQNDVLMATDRVDLEAGATASLMVGDTAIVRLCHGASLGFVGDRGRSTSALNLRTGQLKVSAGKRAIDEPLEIHTPAAIATLLGTEAHVDVDPTTGDTVVTSLHHEIKVSGVGASSDKSVVISAGQKVTIEKGSGPGAVETADVPSISFTSACLDDARYRIAAVSFARHQYGAGVLARIAKMDMVDGEDIPVVSAGPPLIPTGTLGPQQARVCLSYEQCVQASGADPLFQPNPPGPAPTGP